MDDLLMPHSQNGGQQGCIFSIECRRVVAVPPWCSMHFAAACYSLLNLDFLGEPEEGLWVGLPPFPHGLQTAGETVDVNGPLFACRGLLEELYCAGVNAVPARVVLATNV